MTLELPESGDCVFCAIVAGETDASWEVRPGAGDTVACFHNQLKWARVMLLIVPTQHMTQAEFWSSQVLVDAASLAVKMGDAHCGDDGYRVISNFGRVAHQSQVHAHMHVVSGTSSQIEEARKKPGEPTERDRFGFDASGLAIDEFDVDEVPFAVQISPTNPSSSQRRFWDSQQIVKASQAALRIGGQYSPEGFRLLSSFDPSSSVDNRASLFLFGGGQLGLYV